MWLLISPLSANGQQPKQAFSSNAVLLHHFHNRLCEGTITFIYPCNVNSYIEFVNLWWINVYIFKTISRKLVSSLFCHLLPTIHLRLVLTRHATSLFRFYDERSKNLWLKFFYCHAVTAAKCHKTLRSVRIIEQTIRLALSFSTFLEHFKWTRFGVEGRRDSWIFAVQKMYVTHRVLSTYNTRPVVARFFDLHLTHRHFSFSGGPIFSGER